MRLNPIMRRALWGVTGAIVAISIGLPAAGCSPSHSGASLAPQATSQSASPSPTAADARQDVIRSVIGLAVISANPSNGIGPAHPATGQLGTYCIPAGSTVAVLDRDAVEQVKILTVARGHTPRPGTPDIRAGAYAALPAETLVNGRPVLSVRADGTVAHMVDETMLEFVDTAAGLYMTVVATLANTQLQGSVPPLSAVQC
jgi:hypothetical protein